MFGPTVDLKFLDWAIEVGAFNGEDIVEYIREPEKFRSLVEIYEESK